MSPIASRHFFAVALVGCGLFGPSSSLRAESPFRKEPSLAQAAKYLEERSQGWISWKVAQKANGTVCMSCHTTVPYLLAHTILRRELPQAESSRVRFVESARQRVENWDSVRPWHTGAPHRARGSEVVLNTLCLALDDAARGRKNLSEATRKAIANLWSMQVKEGKLQGAWEWYENRLAPWEDKSNYFGATLAALALATAPAYLEDVPPQESSSLEQLRTYLKAKFTEQRLHETLQLVWVARKFPDLLSSEDQQSVLKQALACQNADGTWSASSLGNWKRRDGTANSPAGDAYGTGLVVATLKHIAHGDQSRALGRGIAWLKVRQQSDDGSWSAHSLNTIYAPESFPEAFMRDAATGWAVLALWE